MARQFFKSAGGVNMVWLITYSDLMTLLLSFFVLLLSMSSMNATTIARISGVSGMPSPLDAPGAARIPERVRLVVPLLRNPDALLEKQERIKDLLFPDDVLPPDMPAGTLKENLRILQHPEGAVIVLANSLLFGQGSNALDARGLKLLEGLTPVIQAVNADVNISGYTDNTPAVGINNDELSARRAMAVLDFFLHAKLAPGRFSVSGYGMDKPMYSNDTEEGRVKNRRVEILLKTTKRPGGYL